MKLAILNQALLPLTGLRLQYLGRSGNLLWIGFGDKRAIPTLKGGTRWVADWALHVQCPWRLVQRGRIVVGAQDLYRSPEGVNLADNWEKRGLSKFDQAAELLCQRYDEAAVKVTSIEGDSGNGILSRFDDGSQLEVIPTGSTPGEAWRLFRPGLIDAHVVIGADGSRSD